MMELADLLDLYHITFAEIAGRAGCSYQSAACQFGWNVRLDRAIARAAWELVAERQDMLLRSIAHNLDATGAPEDGEALRNMAARVKAQAVKDILAL